GPPVHRGSTAAAAADRCGRTRVEAPNVSTPVGRCALARRGPDPESTGGTAPPRPRGTAAAVAGGAGSGRDGGAGAPSGARARPRCREGSGGGAPAGAAGGRAAAPASPRRHGHAAPV